jgi:hypothetical protein
LSLYFAPKPHFVSNPTAAFTSNLATYVQIAAIIISTLAKKGKNRKGNFPQRSVVLCRDVLTGPAASAQTSGD